MAFNPKKLLLLGSFLIGCYLLARFCHHQTGGFTLAKIQNNTYELSTPAIHLEKNYDLKALLTQKYSYFSRGLQSFCFLSEDGETVLKLFNNRYQTKIAFWKCLSYFPFFDKVAADKIVYLESKLKMTFDSYQIASEMFPQESALIYFQAHPSQQIRSNVTLVDKLGIKHSVNLNQYAFILQKKATPFYSYLEQLISDRDWAGCHQVIHKLFDLSLLRHKQRVSDRDPLIRTNFGVIDGEPVYIDVGPFVKSNCNLDPIQTRKELDAMFLGLKHWLEKKQQYNLASDVDALLQTP